MYILAFVIAVVLLPRLQHFRGLMLSRDRWMEIISWGVVGVLIGGRLGFVLFYEPAYFFANPLKVFAVWEGGMSSHGGFIGLTLALLFALRREGRSLWKIADIVTVPGSLGLAFGRFGNFINQELYGTVTSLPWGISFPGASGFRHPVQLYELMIDLVIALVCLLSLRRSKTDGRTLAFFLMLYSVARFLLEFVRAQQYPIFMMLTRGQMLTIPLFLAGLCVWFWRTNTNPSMPDAENV
ncbi:MAG: prolipoprotein diacylglyceryl transferase [Candidatus Peribacteraceae bacterium]